jgi:hypothetical protein
MARNDPPLAATAAHLTRVLHGAGPGRVREVEVLWERETVLSRILCLRLTHAGEGPPSLILKTARPGLSGGLLRAGQREVAFYAAVAPATPSGLLPLCHEATWDEASKAWHLLLEDLTDTHATPTAWPLPPSLAQAGAILRQRARFHAAWWDDPRLGREIGAWPTEAASAEHLRRMEAAYRALLERTPDLFPPARRELYARLFAAAPRLMARDHSRRHMTVTHGDAHAWNCLLPHDPARGAPVLFDWDCWGLGVATDDLAYMMALHWYPAYRATHEAPLLEAYHAELLAAGVLGYGLAALRADYRLSVLWQLMTPLRQSALGIPPVIWWNHLERICLAVEDLGCADLL